MASVFIAGHGRMRRSGSVAAPAGVSIAWAVPPTYNGSGGLSTALLSGAYDGWAGHTRAGEPYYDHYLCPDIAAIMANKAVALSQGNRTPRGEIYLLQPRLKFTTTLSSIVLFLKRRVPGPLQIYWTCCRSPIGEPSSRIRLFEGGTTGTSRPAGMSSRIRAWCFHSQRFQGRKSISCSHSATSARCGPRTRSS